MDIISIKKYSWYTFLNFSGLTLNLSKCEIPGTGALKGVQVAVCGIKCVDLNNDTLKILGTHFSYYEKQNNEKTFTQM